MNPRSVPILKQVGRSLHLLGKHRQAIEVFEQALRFGGPYDWEVRHAKGVCHVFLRQLDRAIEEFRDANTHHRNLETYLQLGHAYTLNSNFELALETYKEASEFMPESAELQTTLGLLHLRMGRNDEAFEKLGSSLALNPRDVRTILAAGSIIQDHKDWDVALLKYRIAAAQSPNNSQLWNNIGMCFFGKRKLLAAIACLRRASYLAPFEWIIQYNLGIVHLHTGQFASAFHHLSAAIQLHKDFAASYHYLAVALSRLGDAQNAIASYHRAARTETCVAPSLLAKSHLYESVMPLPLSLPLMLMLVYAQGSLVLPQLCHLPVQPRPHRGRAHAVCRVCPPI